MLEDAIFCDRCSLNLKRNTIQERYTDIPLESLRTKIATFKSKIALAHPSEAIKYSDRVAWCQAAFEIV
jgi:hypothetical protein